MNVWTRISYCAVVTLVSQSIFSPQVQAQQDDAAALIANIDAVAEGWEQGDGQWNAENHLSASDTTSMPFKFRCNKSSDCTSCSTSPSP